MTQNTPAEIFAQRLDVLDASQRAAQRLERASGYAKLGIAAVVLCLIPLAFRYPAVVVFVAVLSVAFLVIAVRHERLLEAIRSRSRSIAFYRRGMARLTATWQGSGETGERFLDAAHPYARDLDLFGNASLFQYLCSARTRSGEDALAAWLLRPAVFELIPGRQAAVTELAGMLEFREQLFVAGDVVRSSVEPESMAAWGEAASVFSSAAARLTITVLGVAWIASLIAWGLSGNPLATVLVTVVNFAYSHRIHARLEKAGGAIEQASADLRIMGQLLLLIEQGSFVSPTLNQLQDRLKHGPVKPSTAIARLAKLAEFIQSRHSLLMRPLDLVTFWSAQLMFRAERWQRTYGPSIRTWISAVGDMEALASLAAFAYEHPDYAIPELVQQGPLLHADGLAHPLLADNAVANDVRFDERNALIILSGPNMAGKSTFIRSVGVNAVLAQCGAPVRATRFRMSPLQVGASICVLDSLSGGVSHFYAEVRRLKLIDDLTRNGAPVLFLLDELLSGTNSHDRYEGTRFVLKTFVERGAIGIVSTHDLALTRIAVELMGRAANAHFEDHLEDGMLVFDYSLKPGIVKTSNALKLMRSAGFEVPELLDLPPVE